ncbi:MAG: ABC transporter ATP-binding protein [Hyphomicrobiales bacterium]|nr:ABC transporter ATP-binding protein [Hyphomicrobiales bacterium]
MTAILSFDNVSRRFGATLAVDRVSLSVAPGEFFALLGPSGCGKTTLMRMAAGFETPDEGKVFIAGEDVTQIPAHRRPVNMMFQSYALFPHMSVSENIAFGLKRAGMSRADIAARVAEMARLARLEGLEDRKPAQLSGGQRQRAALARALARAPKLLLLDEPLAALDRKLREATQFELMDIQKRLGTAFVVVTHDQEEAMALADRMAVMRAGRIEQVGAPADVYARPRSRFVADFIGECNLFEGEAQGADIVTKDGVLRAGAPAPHAGKASAIVRPEKLRFVAPQSQGVNVLHGIVHDAAFRGDRSLYRVALPSGQMLRVARSGGAETIGQGVAVSVAFDAQDCVIVDD